ncbi:MAG: hypothetical protein AB1465_01370 [Patescibacteria group bacterium]
MRKYYYIFLLIFLFSSNLAFAKDQIEIEANSVKIPYVDRGVLGGNSVNDNLWDYNFDIYKKLGGNQKPKGKNLNRPLLRLHMMDKGQPKNYWFYKPSLYRRENGLFNPMIPETVEEFNWAAQYPLSYMDLTYENKSDGSPSENYYKIEWLDHSPTYANFLNRHSISYTKIPGSTIQKHRIFSEEKDKDRLLPKKPIYIRFDFKLSSRPKFYIKNKAFIANSAKFRMYLNSDRTFEILLSYPDFNKKIKYNKPLKFDKWYSIEILSDNISKLWLDGKKIGEVKLDSQDTSEDGRSTEIQFGTLVEESIKAQKSREPQIKDSYQFKIDEIEFRTKQDRKFPLDKKLNKKYIKGVILSHSFDNNIMTIDDYGDMAEKLNLEFVPQLPNPCEKKYGCENDSWSGFFKKFYSVKGIAAMFQYLVGEADQYYAKKTKEIKKKNWPLKNLKKFNGNGEYNYANLRASRGRIKPYRINYVELGNEPYYAEYENNEIGFARRFIDLCESLHKIKPDLKCVLPGQSSSTFSFEKVLKYFAFSKKLNLIGGVAIHDYFIYYGKDRIKDYPLRTMNGAYAEFPRYKNVEKLLKKYLNKKQYKNLPIWINEYNSILYNFKENQTDKFIDAAYLWSEVAYMLEHGITGGALFFWNSATIGEGFTNGLIGDYNRKPEINLNGRTFLAFSKYFGWGGKILKIKYNPQKIYDPVSDLNLSKITAISSLSKNGKNLYLGVINRSSNVYESSINLKNFLPKKKAKIYSLKADSLLDSHRNIHYKTKTKDVSKKFNYKFPSLSINFIKLKRK